MDFDFLPYFKKYEALVALADETFDKIKKEYPVLVRCETKCADCCHALFDVSLVEALYINHNFNKNVDGKKKDALLEKANRADRKVYQIKRQANKEAMEGKNEVEIFMNLSKEKVRCPLLNKNDMCDLYEHRPIRCAHKVGCDLERPDVARPTCPRSGAISHTRFTPRMGSCRKRAPTSLNSSVSPLAKKR